MAEQTTGSVRSGRFKWDTPSTNPLSIIFTTTEVLYRVFNSETNPFRVTVLIGGTPIVINSQCSQDIIVPASKSVRIDGTADELIAGVYDRVPGSDTRSGRFKIRGENPVAAHTIINLTGRVATTRLTYRIFNSGEYDFQLNTADTPIVRPEQSIDVELGATDEVTVTPTDVDQQINGIYEILA